MFSSSAKGINGFSNNADPPPETRNNATFFFSQSADHLDNLFGRPAGVFVRHRMPCFKKPQSRYFFLNVTIFGNHNSILNLASDAVNCRSGHLPRSFSNRNQVDLFFKATVFQRPSTASSGSEDRIAESMMV